MVELCPIEYVLNAEHEVTDEQLRAVCNLMWMCGANYINSYWPEDKLNDSVAFSNYLGRMGATLYGAVHDSRIAVYYPVETVQALYKPCNTAIMKNRNSNTEIGKLEEGLRRLTINLWESKLDFDFIDSVALENAILDGNTLIIADMKFNVVIMSGVQVLPLLSLKKIELFEKLGGVVLWVGCLPKHGITLDEIAEVKTYSANKQLCKNAVAEAIKSVEESMQWEGDVIVSRFLKNGQPLYMVINNGGKDITVKGNYSKMIEFEILFPLSGEIVKDKECKFNLKKYSVAFVRVVLQ